MRLYRAILLSITLLIFSELAFSVGTSPQEEYIAKYAQLAIRERQRTGVPASITLAQGMLESGNGMSELAVQGNNHFGIKCHDWKGPSVYFDDDRKGECFRKYKNAEASFRDHSDFLRYRDRYKFLFEFDVTDYQAWAYGLKQAGYATDPAYPRKLIRLIEEYNLDRFDRPGAVAEQIETDEAEGGKGTSGKGTSGKGSGGRTTGGKKGKKPQEEVPQTPSQLETPKPLSDKDGAAFHLSLSRQLYSQNGVPFVYSVEGETYASLARNYDLFLSEILRFNDLEAEEMLLPGTVVYLQPKKAKAAKQVDKYVAEGGESLRDISQRFAVKMSKLMKYNYMEPDSPIREGQTIMLRNKLK